MKKAVIIYGSTTGNTESVANTIKDHLKYEANVVEVSSADSDMVKDSDLVLLGSSTWGYGDIQDDFAAYYDDMSKDVFDGKNVAVFGCGDKDSFEDVFCEATELIKAKAVECGANIVCENIKVNGDPSDNEDAIIGFSTNL